MTNRLPTFLAELPPFGSGGREKFRFRSYEASCSALLYSFGLALVYFSAELISVEPLLSEPLVSEPSPAESDLALAPPASDTVKVEPSSFPSASPLLPSSSSVLSSPSSPLFASPPDAEGGRVVCRRTAYSCMFCQTSPSLVSFSSTSAGRKTLERSRCCSSSHVTGMETGMPLRPRRL